MGGITRRRARLPAAVVVAKDHEQGGTEQRRDGGRREPAQPGRVDNQRTVLGARRQGGHGGQRTGHPGGAGGVASTATSTPSGVTPLLLVPSSRGRYGAGRT
ncbi:hypothetical protein [Halostreptopolyspora alba]|uniref:hypothetical protein n=1 Tax=Halostreptopolyspora alba TaxID=2487137 RepID=UPI0037147F88